MDKVSIIVPVYNVEKYLPTCIESILNQSYKNFELILVDDGSPDKSGDICDDYAKKDNRIKVIHQRNSGSSAARNNGLETSSGEYITFVDSDDWIDENHIETLYHSISSSKVDIVQCDLCYERNDGQKIWSNKPSSEVPRQVILDSMNGRIHAGVVLKMARKNLFEEKSIRFPKYDFFEDMHTSINLLLVAKSFKHVPIASYHYRFNENSQTHNADVNARFTKYNEFAYNMLSIFNNQMFSKDDDLIKSLLMIVNMHKRALLRKYYAYPQKLKESLSIFKNTYSLKDVKSLGDLIFYMACQWNIIFPYSLKEKYKLGHE